MIWRNGWVRALVLVLVALAQYSVVFAQDAAHVFLVSQDPVSRADHEDDWGDDTAFATIQEAVEAAEGDPTASYLILVEIGPIPYVGPVEINAGANIVLRGILDSLATPDRPTIVGSGTSVVSIDGAGSGVTIDTFNIVGGNPGIEITGVDATQVARPTITNCVITGNTDGIECFDNSRPRIINCMIVGNTDSGIVCHGDSGPWLMNDTISENETGVDLLAGGLAIEITNTIAWGNAVDDIPAALTAALTVSYSDIGTVDFGPTNITANPQFFGGGDFHLMIGSPCINVGTDAGAPSTDYEGEARGTVADPDVDIGADEYFAGGPVPPTAYAVPDPTSYQPQGGLLFFVSGSDVERVVAQRTGCPDIRTDEVVPGTIYVNLDPISEETWDSSWDGTWDILVSTGGTLLQAGTFVIDTTPPVVGPRGSNPFNLLDNHNDFVSAADLDSYGYWPGLEFQTFLVEQDVPNDGENFFFNTGARATDGSFPGDPPPLWIDFEVEATDVGSGFDAYWAPSGQPVVRDRNEDAATQRYDPPDPGSAGASTTWILHFKPMTEGAYNIDIVAEDRAGNVSQPVPLRVYWDKTPPETQITSGPRPRESSTEASLTWQLQMPGRLQPIYSTLLQVSDYEADPLPDVYYPFTPFYPAESRRYTGLEVGRWYTFTVLGIDDAGNIETTSGSHNQRVWTVGNPVPDTVILSGPPRITTEIRAAFTFREVPQDPAVTFAWECTSSDREWGGLAGTVPHSGPAQAFVDSLPVENVARQYVFQVRALKGGLYDPTPATYTWTVVPPASPGDPGAPVLPPGVPSGTAAPILDSFGAGQYVDAPGEQPVKYYREQAK